MESENNFNERIVQVVRDTMPSNATVHFVSIIGSRAKGLNGGQSDYDIRAIISNPKSTYLL